MTSRPALILVAAIGAAHGVRGDLRVKSFTGERSAFADYGSLLVDGGPDAVEIVAIRHLRDDIFVVRFKAVGDRNTAAALSGAKLYVMRDMLPDPGQDEFYQSDLIGLSAVTEAGAALGTVVAIANYGAGDILEIQPEGAGDTLLFPFTRAIVSRVDMVAGKIIIVPPEDSAGDGVKARR